MNKKTDLVPSAYAAPIVTKAMRILRFIARSADNPGLSDIASKLSLAKSTTHGILTALESSGWVLRDPITRAYTCGHAMKDLTAMANVRLPLVNTARPFLEKLSSLIREDIFLGIMVGQNLLTLDQVETSKELKVTAKPGTRLSIYAGAAGKIFLAYLEDQRLDEVLASLPLPRFTPKSITDPDDYRRELKRVRDAGFAVDNGEYITNCRAVAAPIFYGKKNRMRMVAGFWLVSLDWQQSSVDLETIQTLTVETGESISRAISNGYA